MGKSEDKIEVYLQERSMAVARAVMLMTEREILKEMTTEEMAREFSKACDISSGIAYVNTALDIIQSMRRRPKTVLGKIRWILRDIWFAIR